MEQDDRQMGWLSDLDESVGAEHLKHEVEDSRSLFVVNHLEVVLELVSLTLEEIGTCILIRY